MKSLSVGWMVQVIVLKDLKSNGPYFEQILRMSLFVRGLAK